MRALLVLTAGMIIGGRDGLAAAGVVGSGGLVAPGKSVVSSQQKGQLNLADFGSKINEGLGWFAQHMQWDFDDVDPSFPLSPFWRFDHRIKSKYLLPTGHDTIRFSTTLRPTGRRGWVTTTINPFGWLQMQGTIYSQGLDTPLAAGSAEAKLPLDAVTKQADKMLNTCLDSVQQGLVGRTVAGGLNTHVLIGAGTRDEPWVGVETDARVALSERGRPLRLRTRVTCNRDYQVPSTYFSPQTLPHTPTR